MSQYYHAVDIGTSSEHHMLACIQDGKIKLEEIYHFENEMKNCKELNKIPVSMSIDTWAVDYVLLDEDDHVLGDSYGYRDHCTDGMDKVVNKVIDVYAKTGIQKQIFNKPVISHYHHLTCEIIVNNRYISIVGYY